MLPSVLTEQIAPKRPSEVFGEPSFVDVDPFNARIFLNEPQQVAGNDHMYTQTGRLYAPTGVDLHDGDVFKYRDNTFLVTGDDQIEDQNPLTHTSFGWAKFAIQRGGAWPTTP